MKKLLLLLFLIPNLAQSLEWVKVPISEEFYIDTSRAKKIDGYLYYWAVRNNLEPDSMGILSTLRYYQSDCKMSKIKYLKMSFYTERMAKGSLLGTKNDPNSEWEYLTPNSTIEFVHDTACLILHTK